MQESVSKAQISEFYELGYDPIKRKEIDKKTIAKMAIADISYMIDFKKSYHSPLPPEIIDWYCYPLDSGHSILSIVSAHAAKCFAHGENPFLCLVPVPVKTVLRGFNIIEGFVIVDAEYNQILGLLTPAEDDEF